MGLDFVHIERSILVIDESDTLIFDDEPSAFQEMMTKSRCICFTATPDDNNIKGAERQVITDLGLTKLEYGYPSESTAPATVNETKAFEDDLAILTFLQDKVKEMPVLFYCTEVMMVYIKESGQAFICADEFGSDAALKKLD